MDDKRVYHKLLISQLNQSKKQQDEDDQDNSWFSYQSLRFKSVWIQGYILELNEKDSDDSMELDDSMQSFKIDDGTGIMFVVLSNDLQTFQLNNGQYIIIAGHLEEDGSKFIVLQTMVDLSKNSKKRESLWKLEIQHIQSLIYKITLPSISNNNIDNNNDISEDINNYTFDDDDDGFNDSSIMVIDNNNIDEDEDIEDIEFNYDNNNNQIIQEEEEEEIIIGKKRNNNKYPEEEEGEDQIIKKEEEYKNKQDQEDEEIYDEDDLWK